MRKYACLPLVLCLLLCSCMSLFPQKADTEKAPRPAPPAQQQPIQAQIPPGPSICFSLALPMQGPMKSVSEKIVSGARAARQEIEGRGTAIHVRLLDTDQPDWLAQLAQLPPQCALVGGPLQSTAFSAAKNSHAAMQRAFFAFLPQLEPGDEGFTAWRFFPSPQDQTEALLGFAQTELGFSSYGALYPDEPYGKRMTEIFRQSVQRHGGTVQAGAYTPGSPTTWTDAAGKLVGKYEINKTPFPSREFQAIFLPDSWSSMEQIITGLRYNGEDKALLFGSSLWGEGILAKPPVVLENYKLAVFPGPWSPALPAPKVLADVQAGSPDFWRALGYDFVHFGARMNLAAGWTSQQVNARALEAQQGPWNMAPLHWDAQGKASQALFLFTPVVGGYAPLNPEILRQSLAEAQALYAERLRIAQGGSPAPPPLLGTPAAQQQPQPRQPAPAAPLPPPPATQTAPIER